MADTSAEFDSIINQCLSLFEKKSYDYGTAWRILRLPSLTDQIFIKAQRIRSLQTLSERKVEEGEVSEFIGLITSASAGVSFVVEIGNLENRIA